ncbi:Crp/Fnr family transcriptional regulator [Streptomyces sp. MW-W600-10]|uniref:Crp/Fnr family transcriptional regulator n=1 Tax=Streptomyces sp. MW-W600-10 TaxID=2829819 RepID=UPI001C488238|nr:Crp/Fnr family transcriptional regulator [Streptomyces sp. MW-W600-10]MBV7245980.1 Crp/Fnr family transcriptional regulator [Streptomyces sp. MW-W600-10]
MLGEAWSELLAQGRVLTYPKGKVLMYQGEAGDRLFSLTKGVVSIVHRGADGSETWLGHRGPGELLGDMSAISGEARNADVVAVSSCTVVSIELARFLEFVGPHGPVFDLLRREHAKRQESDLRLCGGRTLPLIDRLARYVLGLVQNSPTLQVSGCTQQDLAQALGVSRGKLNQALGQLRENGVLEVRRRTITVKNLDALRSMAGSGTP